MYAGLNLYFQTHFFVGGHQEDGKQKTAEASRVHSSLFIYLILWHVDICDWLEGSTGLLP